MYTVIDTNIILLDANNIYSIGANSTVVIPETVIDEVDNKKSGLGELAYQAREFGRLLAKAKNLGIETTNNLVITKFDLDGVALEVVSVQNYPSYADTEPAIINDRKIIEVAQRYQLLGNIPLTFMSNDVMCRLRAQALGLTVSDLKEVEETDIKFCNELQVSPEEFSILNHKSISDIYPGHKPENFSYKFTCSSTNQVKLATIINGSINIIGKTEEKDLRQQLIMPNNADQIIMSALIQDQTTDITICDSMAGSGKTIMAMSNAMKLVGINSPYDNIIYIRNTVDDVAEQDEEVGFLSGNDEKMAVYLHPFYDTLSTIARNALSGKAKGQQLEEKVAAKVDEYIAKYHIQAMVALGLRGRTFDNAVIIIDEAQNMSKATMQKVLSRVGKNCKVIVIGSLRQIDSKYITKYTSGLSVLLDSCTRTDLPIKINAVTLHKVVRGPITQFAELVFAKDFNET
jgi:PhoH-like ATPase